MISVAKKVLWVGPQRTPSLHPLEMPARDAKSMLLGGGGLHRPSCGRGEAEGRQKERGG